MVRLRDTVRLSSTLHHLRDMAEQNDGFSRQAIPHLLRDMIYQTQKERLGVPQSVSGEVVADHTMAAARDHIEERAFGDMSLAQVARDVYLTPVQLTRRFRAAFGHTPVVYLTQLRLTRVRAFLLESDMPLGQIAAQCGFNSEHYLSRVFYQAYGVRPGQYREEHRG